MIKSNRLRLTYSILEKDGINLTQKIVSGRYFSIMSPKPDCSRFMVKIPWEET